MGKLENHFKTGLEIIILKSKRKSLRGGGTWLKKWPCKREPDSENRCLNSLLNRQWHCEALLIFGESQLSNYPGLDIRDVLSKEPRCPSLHGFDLAC